MGTKKSKYRILIVDDEPEVRELLGAALAQFDWDPHCVASADRALDRLSDDPDWDLVLTDLLMPGLPGEMFLEKLAREYPSLPVVVMTGFPSYETARAAIRSGASDYLEKPFDDMDGFRSRLENVLNHRVKRDQQNRVVRKLSERNQGLETRNNLLKRQVRAAQRNLKAQMRSLQQSREIFYTDLSRVMAIIDNIVDGIVFTDPGGKVILINPAAGVMLGIPSFIALGKALEGVEGNADLLDCLIIHRSEEPTEHGLEEDVSATHEGHTNHYTVRSGPVFDFQGKLSGVLSLIRDDSSRKKTENLKNQYLSIVAHELRTPLTALKAFGTILERGIYGPLKEEQQGIVRDMLSQSDRLGHEIDKLINLGRLEATDFRPDLREISAAELARPAISPFKAQATEKRISLYLQDESEDAMVLADVADVRRAIRALIENALKFTGEGGSIEVGVRKTKKDVVFEVKDTGIGIARQDQAVIFEKFMQLENPLTRKHGGSGLGLSFAVGILRAHGTGIEVESELGRGAAFRFRLPLVDVEKVPEPQTASSTETESQ